MMKIIVLLVVLAFSSIALASKPYGMAGCGLGSMLLGKDGPQILAVTSNEIGTQSFAISSGTSNCVTATQTTAQIRNFIEFNHESVVTEMAQGSGDSVATLASLYGCDPQAFSSGLKDNYSIINTQNADATSIMININSVIESHPGLSSNCTHAI